METQRLQASLSRAIEELNAGLPPEKQLENAPQTALFGEGAPLDSLELVNLITLFETEIEDEFDRSITLASEKAVSLENSPFRTVGSLTEYALSLLRDGAAGH